MPKPKQKKVQDNVPILYPEFVVKIHDRDHDGPITKEQMMALMGWETEEDYAVRLSRENPGAKTIKAVFDEWDLYDENKRKVRCWAMSSNRPFRESHARKLAQDILQGNWAGPTTMPGQTCNGETIIVGRTGKITSGNHRGVGFILGCQRWAKNKEKYVTRWPEEPVLESLVVFGASEDARVVQTLDNVMPRSLSDVIYTSGAFGALDRKGKNECSRMLAKAVDLLWSRTGAGDINTGSDMPYQTHSASVDFMERHERIFRCVKHLFEENKDRAFSLMKLSPGQCAACMYLMAASASDGDQYRSKDAPSEKQIDFSRWDQAAEFWVELALAGSGKGKLKAVQAALAGLIDEEAGTSGRLTEKLAILAAAWEVSQAGQQVGESDLALRYREDEDGRSHLIDPPDFGGIDLGSKPEAPEEDVPTPEQIAQEKKRIADEHLARKLAKVRGTKLPEEPSPEKITYDKSGKPPIPKLKEVPKPRSSQSGAKRATRKDVEAEQTAKAAAADAEDVTEGDGDEDYGQGD